MANCNLNFHDNHVKNNDSLGRYGTERSLERQMGEEEGTRPEQGVQGCALTFLCLVPFGVLPPFNATDHYFHG